MAVIFTFILCVLIWGSTWYGIELQLGIVPKEWSLAYRFGLSAILLMAWCKFRNMDLAFSLKQHRLSAGLGLFLFSSNYFLVYTGTEYLTSGLVAVAFSLLSFFNIFTGRIFLKSPIQTPVIIAAIMGIFGLVLIFWPEMESLSLHDTTAIGLAFCIGATLFASVGNTIAGSDSAKVLSIIPFNAWGLTYGAIFNIIFALISGESPAIDPRPIYWISLIYLSLFGTVIAFTLYLWLMEKMGMARAGYIAVMTPIVALIISTFLEGFMWTLPAVIGLSLVILGNIVMINKKQQQQPADV
ncbi:DMT family transporter [Kordiimonas sp. SCSIO 12610]|uniref:DMT family transporter n=1 Tax=Kordiimonas sp. SCSIO 12610 TaxID=2829597 RepID=UPI00210F22A2|nr:DMT family transporter [Kordiimonas sp. SCSIO 12610]UTW54544.1 EamA family transporter [Kordiimonas sp. SCSIO 12610]